MMGPTNYCYFCNAVMLHRWVCADCVKKYKLEFNKKDATPELAAFEPAPSRKSPDTPIPDGVMDYILAYHADDLRLIVMLVQQREKANGLAS